MSKDSMSHVRDCVTCVGKQHKSHSILYMINKGINKQGLQYIFLLKG